MCWDRKQQHCVFTIEADKGLGGKQTDDPLLPISTGMHLKWKWLTFKCNSQNHKTDETWEPKQIFHPNWSRLSSGDVSGMIARRRLACVDSSSRNPRRCVWTGETQEIADRTEKWLFCLIHDFDLCADVFVRRVCVCVCVELRSSCLRRSCTLQQCRRYQTSACSGGVSPNHEPLHAKEPPPGGRDRMSRSKNITWTNSRDGSFEVRQRILHRSVLTLFKHWMTSSRPREGNNDAISDYN